MAVTILASPLQQQIPPVTRIRNFQLVFSGTYAANGEAITAANLGMSRIFTVQITASPIAYFPSMVPTTPNAADGSFATFNVAWNDGTAAGAVAELANGAYPAAISSGWVYATIMGR